VDNKEINKLILLIPVIRNIDTVPPNPSLYIFPIPISLLISFNTIRLMLSWDILI